MLPFITKTPYHREMPLGPVPVPIAGTMMKGHGWIDTMDLEQSVVPPMLVFLRRCVGKRAARPRAQGVPCNMQGRWQSL